MIKHIDSSSGNSAQTLAPLKICYILGAFPVLSETFVTNEIRAVRRLGHDVVPVTMTEYDGPYQPDDEDLKSEAVRVTSSPRAASIFYAARRPLKLADAVRFAMRQKSLRPRSLLLAGARVARIAAAAGCSHIHAHFAQAPAATAIIAARMGGMTCSFTGHGFDVYGSPFDLAAKLGGVDFAVAVCQDMATDFRGLSPQARITTVHCGVDPGRFVPLAEGCDRNGRLLAIGRLSPQKGYEVLFAALALLPPERRPMIDVVGGGALLESMLLEVERVGVTASINLLGPRNAGWIAEHGPRYSGFVAPYVITADGDRDTGPLVVKEAMSMGLPVVASALMGLKEIVSPETGRLVPPGDPQALAEAINWLSSMDETTRRRLGTAGRARVSELFTVEAQANGLIAAIHRAQEA